MVVWLAHGRVMATSQKHTIFLVEQTKEEFVQELVDLINATNLYRVVRQVEKVTFD